MSEDEIIKYIKEEIEDETDTFHWFDDTPNNKTRKQIEESIKAHQGLLDLYQKAKDRIWLMESEFNRLENLEDNTIMLESALKEEKEKNEVLQKELHQKIKALDIAMSNPDYICKDKIREKIKQLEIFKKALPVRTVEIERFIGELKELLEEQDEQ